MNPLWFPLMTMLAALGADQAERPPRPISGEPLRKTIFDHADEVFGPMVLEAKAFLTMLPGARLEDLILYMARKLRASPTDSGFTATVALIYSLAKSTPERSIWRLEPDAFEALTNTDLPWELVRDRLPRLPYDGLLVQLPKGERMPVHVFEPFPFDINISSFLVVEEIPGQKWRYIGLADNEDFSKVAYSRGWLDLGVASARAQLKGGQAPPVEMQQGRFTTVTVPAGMEGMMQYELTGEDRVWQLLLNLFLALEHHHLDGQRIRPDVPRGRQGRRFTQRYSPREYTVVRLSQASKDEQRKQKATAEASEGRRPMRRHLVSGHWRSVWVTDPGDKPVFATKPRVGRDGRTLEGNLFKTAVWIFPFWKGEGDDPGSQAKKYKVKLA